MHPTCPHQLPDEPRQQLGPRTTTNEEYQCTPPCSLPTHHPVRPIAYPALEATYVLAATQVSHEYGTCSTPGPAPPKQLLVTI